MILNSMENKKVLVFLAKGFETMEFSVFIDVLGWARNDYGHNLFVDTCGFTDRVESTFNVPVIAFSNGVNYYRPPAKNATTPIQ